MLYFVSVLAFFIAASICAVFIHRILSGTQRYFDWDEYQTIWQINDRKS